MFRQGCFLDFPLIAEVRLVQHQHERQRAQLLGDALLQFHRLGERHRAAAIHHQDVAGRAAKMRSVERCDAVLARQIPEHQGEGFGSDSDILAIDLDPTVER